MHVHAHVHLNCKVGLLSKAKAMLNQPITPITAVIKKSAHTRISNNNLYIMNVEYGTK